MANFRVAVDRPQSDKTWNRIPIGNVLRFDVWDRRRRILLGSAILAAYLGMPVFCQPRDASDAQLVLIGGTIYVSPAEEPIRNGAVVIRDGKIAAVGRRTSLRIPRATRTLDCTGFTITAGFWNSHVHFMERKWADVAKTPAPELTAQLQAMLTRYGITSVFDTGSMWENTRLLRNRIEAGEIPGPRIRSTGEILYPKGALSGSPPPLMDALGFMRVQIPEVATATEALTASQKLLDAGVDGIKLYAQAFWPPRPSLPESAIQAAVMEAHRRGKPAFAHPTSREGLVASVRGGVDVLVHTTPQSRRWDETVLAAMKESRVAVIPTLKLWKYELRHDRMSAQEQFLNAGIGQLRDWVAAGGTVLFGTDVGYMADYDPREEYALMAEAGMDFRQILASLTTAPVERFGESIQQGRIAAGLAADLVVVSGDPSKDVRALAAVRYTIRGGRVIYQARN